MPSTPNKANPLKPGDLYEDPFFHPCLCVGIDDAGFAWGISLIDGSYPRSTDLYMSGLRRLTPEEAWEWKMKGLGAVEALWLAEVDGGPDRESS